MTPEEYFEGAVQFTPSAMNVHTFFYHYANAITIMRGVFSNDPLGPKLEAWAIRDTYDLALEIGADPAELRRYIDRIVLGPPSAGRGERPARGVPETS